MMKQSEAVKKGQEVLELLGEGWKYDVWENIGWHVRWFNGAVKLHYNRYEGKDGYESYSVLIGEANDEDVSGIDPFTPHNEACSDPIAAVRNACNECIATFDTLVLPILKSVITVRSKY